MYSYYFNADIRVDIFGVEMTCKHKTKIEWTDYTWNPVTGCKHGCPYCYARKISNRFYGNFEPTFHPERLKEPYNLKKPSKIFVVSMGDLFGDWVPITWIKEVIKVAEQNPQHTFQFLTKNPFRYTNFNFPKNCWLGTTVNTKDDEKRIPELNSMSGINKTFISFEPLLGEINYPPICSWIIIGAQTNPEIQPKKEWVQKLIDEAWKRNIPVFLKDNLNWEEKIKQFPEEMRRKINV